MKNIKGGNVMIVAESINDNETETSRDLTDEELKIYNNQLESESIETGVKLF